MRDTIQAIKEETDIEALRKGLIRLYKKNREIYSYVDKCDKEILSLKLLLYSIVQIDKTARTPKIAYKKIHDLLVETNPLSYK